MLDIVVGLGYIDVFLFRRLGVSNFPIQDVRDRRFLFRMLGISDFPIPDAREWFSPMPDAWDR